MVDTFTPEELFAALYRWLAINHPGVSRRFLEMHPELLSPAAVLLIERIFADMNEPSGLIWQMFDSDDSEEGEEERQQLRERIGLLYDIHQRGRSARAMREAYIDVYGGIALDMPPWLENAIKRLQMLTGGEVSQGMLPMLTGGLRRIVNQAERAPDVPTEMLAELHFYLQETLKEDSSADTAPVQEERIAILQDILQTYTLDRYPRRYAEVQHNLGLIYKQREAGERQENLNEAMACLKRAIEVYAPEMFLKERAMNQYNLGNVLMMAHLNRTKKDSQELLKESIACFQDALRYYTRAAHSFEYAKIQQSLAGAYADYVEGERFAHLEQALQCFQVALEIFTIEKHPLNYAEAHYLLALLYKERIEYDRVEELEKALLSCQNALHIYTLARFPQKYARTQNLMGELYVRRVAGTRETNGEEAIACYNRALQVFTLESDALEHAETLNLLGNAYQERMADSRSENQEKALAHFARALEIFETCGNARGVAKIHYNLAIVYSDRLTSNRAQNQELAIDYCLRSLKFFTRESYPDDYAQTQNTLGTIYKERIRGDVRANLEEAIQCYQRALEILALAHFSRSYAEVQHNLGNAYINRVEGIRRDNIEEAMRCYQRALAVFTKDDFPVQYAAAHIQLGIAYRERIEGERRANREEALACFERALQIVTLAGTPVEYGKAHHNMANVYKERIMGSQQENQEAAIYHYREALKVNTLTNFPDGYAMAEDSLGVIYSHRIEGDRRANLEYAIDCHRHALEVFKRETFPLEYGRAMSNLGITYTQRVEGNPDTNLEEAIQCFEAALEVFTPETAPIDHANAHRNLGVAHMLLSGGEQRYHLELAIKHFERALLFITADTSPFSYAEIQNNLGVAYKDRIEGEHRVNVEQAIACHRAALRILTLEASPVDYGKTQNNLGAAYMERNREAESVQAAFACFKAALSAYETDPTSPLVAGALVNLGVTYTSRSLGEQRDSEEAINCFKRALQIYRRETFPHEFARAQLNLGNAYARRVKGHKHVNQEEAIKCYNEVLTIYTRDAFPRQHRDTHLNMAIVQSVRQLWEEAHLAYASAMEAEKLLIALGAGAAGRDAIIKEGGDAAIDNGYALIRLARITEAAISIERGRARGLAESMALDAASPSLIGNLERRERYEQARRDLIRAQAALNTQRIDTHAMFSRDIASEALESIQQYRELDLLHTEAYYQAKARFDAVITEIDEAQDPPDFLDVSPGEATILRAAAQCGPGHAIVYLAATSWGSIAIAAFSGNPELKTMARFGVLDLPQLTDTLVGNLIEEHLNGGNRPVISSFAAVQAEDGFDVFTRTWEGETFYAKATELHDACSKANVGSTFDQAAQKVLEIPWLGKLVDIPFEQMSFDSHRLLARVMEHVLLQHELRRCLDALAQTALRPLATWLQEEGATSCTLIPCGYLAAFPLLAAEVYAGHTFSAMLPASVAPSARSLLQETGARNRTGVYSLGDPRPTHQELLWGEAEALTIATLARLQGLPKQVKVQEKATLARLIGALEHGFIVDASCHGRFDTYAPLDSTLSLANRQYLRLRDLLSHEVDMRGLRLLILSACQTAILDLHGAVNEVRSLAAGMAQAGAQAVLAALWSVDDKATYLLMVRFMQEWLPKANQEPPAKALARAQRWLRNITYRELQQWHAGNFPTPTPQERSEAGSDRPEHDPWLTDPYAYSDELLLATVPKRGNRYDTKGAEEWLHALAQKFERKLDTRPYADPFYWAGFQITGW